MSRTIYASNKKTRTVVAVGVFAAFAYILTFFFRFRLAFLTFDLKDAVMTICGMLFGPLYGSLIAVLVPLLEMIISSTGLYGFVMNALASVTFVWVGSFIYTHNRTMRGALIGMFSSVLTMNGVMQLANYLITPGYLELMAPSMIPAGMSARSFVATLLLPLIMPFNLTKGVFNASLVFLFYKPISQAVRKAGFDYVLVMNGGKTEGNRYSRKTGVAVTVLAAVVAVATLMIFFIVLGGSFKSFG